MKLIIFDFDGVLCDCKEIHYKCLNDAITWITGNEYFLISREEHLGIFDGLKTRDKLKLLTDRKQLPVYFHDNIWRTKQHKTKKEIENLKPDINKIEILSRLKKDGYKLACCSNSIKDTLVCALNRLGILQLFDLIVSNQDVINSKPMPDCYWKAMMEFNCPPEETLILEDSPNGLLAARRSGAQVFRVDNANGYTYNDIINYMNFQPKYKKWTNPKMNVLIPMAGEGSRFAKAGYSFPKPIIDVLGQPMIKWVVDSLNIDANFIFLAREEHIEKYNLVSMLRLIAPNCSVLAVKERTDGAARTALLAKELINNDNPLLIANSDQFIEWDSMEFFYKMQETGADGGILTFENTHPKWSYCKVDNAGLIKEVAEKKVISNCASVGIYFYKRGADFVKYAERMIDKNIRVNGEFYVCPAYNEYIQDGKTILPYKINKMHGLGTPEDLEYFIRNR